MLSLAVCEDDEIDRKALEDVLAGCAELSGAESEVCYYTDGRSLIEAIQGGKPFALLILDIYMGDLNGVDTAKAARILLPDVQIAFLTSSRDFGPEAFALDSIHYLMKPVGAAALTDLLHRFFARVGRTASVLEIQTEWKSYQFPLDRVYRLQSDNKGVSVYVEGMETPRRIPETFIQVEKQVKDPRFLKISRGLLVNMAYILRMDTEQCRLKDGTAVLISRKNRSEIRRKYNNYLFDLLDKEENL